LNVRQIEKEVLSDLLLSVLNKVFGCLF